MRDWCSECKFENFGGSQEPCYNCVTTYNKKPSEFTPAIDEVRGVGCPVCQNKEPLPEDGMSHEYYIRGNTLYHYDTHFGWEGSEINYCPNCGAKMEVSEDE